MLWYGIAYYTEYYFACDICITLVTVAAAVNVSHLAYHWSYEILAEFFMRPKADEIDVSDSEHLFPLSAHQQELNFPAEKNALITSCTIQHRT